MCIEFAEYHLNLHFGCLSCKQTYSYVPTTKNKDVDFWRSVPLSNDEMGFIEYMYQWFEYWNMPNYIFIVNKYLDSFSFV